MKKIIICLSCFFLALFILSPFSQAMENMQEISVIAKQFEFIPSQIVVENGRPVKIYATSLDVTHGFYIGDFKVNQLIEKGKLTVIEFTPNKSRVYDFQCSKFCGLGHQGMKGKLVVKDSEMKMDTKKMDMKKSDCGMPGM